MNRIAFITGVTGQDGSYLTELLLAKDYEVHGLIRRSSNFNTQRIDHIYQSPTTLNRKLYLHYGDLADGLRMTTLLNEIKPVEIYHLAAQSHVRVSFDEPENTGNITGIGTTRLLEAIRRSTPDSKFYQASSSEMFGSAAAPQNEETTFKPRSPYGAAKLYSYWMARNYREAYGLYTVNGILFNHESPRRGETFVTRKITRAVARIAAGQQQELVLGNLNAKRDWGYAPEFVVAMWRMMQKPEPQDYVIGTGSSMSVLDFVKLAFNYVNLHWENYVRLDDRYVRPTEVDNLLADASKAYKELPWKAETTQSELVKVMLEHDIKTIDLNQTDVPKSQMWINETQS